MRRTELSQPRHTLSRLPCLRLRVSDALLWRNLGVQLVLQ